MSKCNNRSFSQGVTSSTNLYQRLERLACVCLLFRKIKNNQRLYLSNTDLRTKSLIALGKLNSIVCLASDSMLVWLKK